MKVLSTKSILREQSRLITLSALLLSITGALKVLFAFVIAGVIDASLNLDMLAFQKAIVIAVAMLFFSCLFSLMGNNVSRKYAARAAIKHRNELMSRVLSATAQDYAVNSEAYYLNILNDEVGIIKNNFYLQIPRLILEIILIVGSIVALLYINWALFVVVCLLICVAAVVPHISAKFYSEKLSKFTKMNELLISYTKSILGGFELIKTYSLQQHILKDFNNQNTQREQSNYRLGVVQNAQFEASNLVAFMLHIGTIVAGVFFVFRGSLEIAMLFAAVQVVQTLVYPLQELTERLGVIKGSKELIAKHDKILETIGDMKGQIKLKSEDISSIEFVNASFQYSDSTFCLNHITYTFEAGKKYAIIGKSGSGKSTMLKLMRGYYSNYSGNVLINTQEIRDIENSSLYEKMSFLHQNVVLLEDTLGNNIKLFRNVEDEKLGAVISTVRLEELHKRFEINPMSADSISAISGGEKQRIAVARSLVHNNRVLLLDEATAAIDPEDAQEIYNIMFDLPETTLIAVTHDWSDELLDRFDAVLHLENGNLTNAGRWSDIKGNV